MDAMDVTNEDVYCDKTRLNQVLLNLLSNAVKFTPAGGTVSVRLKQFPGKTKDSGLYEIRVKDSGIGISPEFVQKIFSPFERERTSTVSRTQGTGLGMAITKNIVDMMGGTIEVQTEQGKGTEFIVFDDYHMLYNNKFPYLHYSKMYKLLFQIYHHLNHSILFVDQRYLKCEKID